MSESFTMENFRREEVARINSEVKSDDKSDERKRLEEKYGQVWDTQELQKDFDVIGFLAPYIEVRRKKDGESGSMEFQHSPRLYFNFKSHP